MSLPFAWFLSTLVTSIAIGFGESMDVPHVLLHRPWEYNGKIICEII